MPVMKVSKAIIVMEGATDLEMDDFIKGLSDKNENTLLTNGKCRVFRIMKGEVYEVHESLTKVLAKKEDDSNGKRKGSN